MGEAYGHEVTKDGHQVSMHSTIDDLRSYLIKMQACFVIDIQLENSM